MPSIKVGQSYQATLTGSDGSIPASSTSTTNSGGVVSITHAGNVATVRGVAPGATNIVYSAPGYNNVSDSVTVAALPNLVISNGPVA